MNSGDRLLCRDGTAEGSFSREVANKFEASMAKVKESQDQELLDFVARRLMEMAADIIMAHLLIQDATKAPELFAKSRLFTPIT